MCVCVVCGGILGSLLVGLRETEVKKVNELLWECSKVNQQTLLNLQSAG